MLLLGAADAFGMLGLGGLVGLDDITDLQESLNTAEDEVLEKQNLQASKMGEFENLYGYQGGAEYDRYMNAAEKLLAQAEHDPELKEFLDRHGFRSWHRSNLADTSDYLYFLDGLREQVRFKDNPARFNRELFYYQMEYSDLMDMKGNADSQQVIKEFFSSYKVLRESNLFFSHIFNFIDVPFTVDYFRVPEGVRNERAVVSFLETEKAVYVDEPARATERAQQAVEVLQNQLDKIRQAQQGLQVGVVAVESAGGLMVGAKALPSRAELEKTWFGKLLDFKKKWIGPISMFGLFLSAPAAATALRSERTKVAHLAELLLDALCRSPAAQNASDQQEMPRLFLDVLNAFEANGVAKPVQAAVLKKGTPRLVRENNALNQVDSELKNTLATKNLAVRQYFTAHQAGANLSTLPWQHKSWAGAKAAWSLFKYAVNRFVHHSIVLPVFIQFLSSLVYKNLTSAQLSNHWNTRAEHLKTKGLTVLRALFKNPQSNNRELELSAV